jgi:hypothetical protein
MEKKFLALAIFLPALLLSVNLGFAQEVLTPSNVCDRLEEWYNNRGDFILNLPSYLTKPDENSQYEFLKNFYCKWVDKVRSKGINFELNEENITLFFDNYKIIFHQKPGTMLNWLNSPLIKKFDPGIFSDLRNNGILPQDFVFVETNNWASNYDAEVEFPTTYKIVFTYH